MFLFGYIIKILIVFFIMRTVMTRQELHFNPIGKAIAAVTEPIFTAALKVTKKTSDRLTPVIITALVFLYALIMWLGGSHSYSLALYSSFIDLLNFIFLFYVISILVGSFNGKGVGYYTTYFYRVGVFWVKLARTFVPVRGNLIIIPAILLLSVAYMLIAVSGITLYAAIGGHAAGFGSIIVTALFFMLGSVADLLNIMIMIIVVRALMSWVSPDPRNPIVQLIITLSDPITEPFRKIIPPLGMIDVSPIVAIMILSLVRGLLIKLISGAGL